MQPFPSSTYTSTTLVRYQKAMHSLPVNYELPIFVILWPLWQNASYKQQKGGQFYFDSHFQQTQSIVAWLSVRSVLEQNVTSVRTSGRISSFISANRKHRPGFNRLEASQEQLMFSKPIGSVPPAA